MLLWKQSSHQLPRDGGVSLGPNDMSKCKSPQQCSSTISFTVMDTSIHVRMDWLSAALKALHENMLKVQSKFWTLIQTCKCDRISCKLLWGRCYFASCTQECSWKTPRWFWSSCYISGAFSCTVTHNYAKTCLFFHVTGALVFPSITVFHVIIVNSPHAHSTYRENLCVTNMWLTWTTELMKLCLVLHTWSVSFT